MSKEIETFVQINSEDSKIIRYIACGIIEDKGLTGYVYGYAGGGSFYDSLIVNGKFFPNFTDNGMIQSKGQKDYFNKLVGNEELYKEIMEELKNIVIKEEDNTLLLEYDLYEKAKETQVLATEGFIITPPSFYNTYWESTPYETLDDNIYECLDSQNNLEFERD